jgi:hypothetical protein
MALHFNPVLDAFDDTPLRECLKYKELLGMMCRIW